MISSRDSLLPTPVIVPNPRPFCKGGQSPSFRRFAAPAPMRTAQPTPAHPGLPSCASQRPVMRTIRGEYLPLPTPFLSVGLRRSGTLQLQQPTVAAANLRKMNGIDEIVVRREERFTGRRQSDGPHGLVVELAIGTV